MHETLKLLFDNYDKVVALGVGLYAVLHAAVPLLKLGARLTDTKADDLLVAELAQRIDEVGKVMNKAKK